MEQEDVALVASGRCEAQMAAILQLSQYCTFTRDSISTVITEPGQPGSLWPLRVWHCRVFSVLLLLPQCPQNPTSPRR